MLRNELAASKGPVGSVSPGTTPDPSNELASSFLVLFMQVGFALLVTGLTRAKNAGYLDQLATEPPSA
jgi:hypothetical protein